MILSAAIGRRGLLAARIPGQLDNGRGLFWDLLFPVFVAGRKGRIGNSFRRNDRGIPPNLQGFYLDQASDLYALVAKVVRA